MVPAPGIQFIRKVSNLRQPGERKLGQARSIPLSLHSFYSSDRVKGTEDVTGPAAFRRTAIPCQLSVPDFRPRNASKLVRQSIPDSALKRLKRAQSLSSQCHWRHGVSRNPPAARLFFGSATGDRLAPFATRNSERRVCVKRLGYNEQRPPAMTNAGERCTHERHSDPGDGHQLPGSDAYQKRARQPRNTTAVRRARQAGTASGNDANEAQDGRP